MLILIDLVVEFELETILRFSDEEIADSFWDRVLYIPQNKAKV